MKRTFLFFVVMVAVVAGCVDDEQFSSDGSSALSFSVSSLELDTVFCRVASRTYGFWVYNNTDAGIRIREVCLRDGSLGFRVNVDGGYLEKQMNDLELRRNDSLMVFVELTAPTVDGLEPQRVEETLVFRLENGREQSVPLTAYCWNAERLLGLRIQRDTTIESKRPVVIYGDLTVDDGVTLTLRHTQFYFHDGTGIMVNGTLQADDCLFRGDRLDKMFSYLPYDRVSGQWKGLAFAATSQNNAMTDCEIRNACNAITCGKNAQLTMERCRVHNSKGDALSANGAILSLTNCQLTNALGACLRVEEGSVSVSHSTIAQFYPFSADRQSAMMSVNAAVDCSYTLVTGYEDDVIDLSGDGYIFHHCILRSPQPENQSRFEEVRWERVDDEIHGKAHFVTIDEDNLFYEFTLRDNSPAFQSGIGDIRTH